MKQITAALAVCIFLLFSACSMQDDSVIEIRTSDAAAPETTGASNEETVRIAVYICGEVQSPGVYYLDEGSRIADAIDAAGGPCEDADMQSINLAQRLADGQQIVVNSRISGSESPMSAGSPGNGRINLNFATKEDLMTLPGIGEAKADAIIRYREEVGWIAAADEIMNISGIKSGVYDKIAGLIEV